MPTVLAAHLGAAASGQLDLFPLIVTPQSWQQIQAGVLQRMHLLEAIMADVYGPQRLIADNLLPPALVHGHPGYLRALHGSRPAGGRHLHLAAFDLARDAQGCWWAVSQHTQAPSGLGYLLENRQVIERQFPEAFETLKVQPLAGSYSALLDGLRAMSPAGDQPPRIVLLTPGPYNETYFEQAFLARHLGLTLVEGNDLTVRDERLYLKTLQGLEPVHGILKRLDDEFLDPLELRADSRLGVPGLLQAVRAGHVLIANAPGSALLESPGLLGFLPAISQRLLGQTLQLPSLATWWCGERAALDAVLPLLGSHVIKPTYASPGSGTVLGPALSQSERDEWALRLARQPDDFTVQAYLPLSQLPTWADRQITPRSLLLRVFVLPDGQGGGWRVLPGGLTRLAGATQETASMQRGGSSADTWVLTQGQVDRSPLPAAIPSAGVEPPRERIVTSRAAENLFWMGRYTERTENTVRLARLLLRSLGGEALLPGHLGWLGTLARDHGLVPPDVPPASQTRQSLERSLVATLADTRQAASVGFNLAGLRHAASAVRDRLSQTQWRLIERAQDDFLGGCAACANDPPPHDPTEALRVLDALSVQLDAMTGMQADRLNRDEGWRLLSAGRHLERLAFLSKILSHGLAADTVSEGVSLEALLTLFDGTLTDQALHATRKDLPALIDRMVMAPDNPRSLAWVTRALRGQLDLVHPGLGQRLPDPLRRSRDEWLERDAQGGCPHLLRLLRDCISAAGEVSDELAAQCFNPADNARHSVGA